MGAEMFIPLVGAGLSFIGGQSAAQQNIEAQKLANEGNMRLAEYQWMRNFDMWKMANEYNKPISQRIRMEQAGFNPNLVYGHGNVVNTSGPAPQYQAPTLQAYTNIPNVLGGAVEASMNIAKGMAEVKKANADAVKSQADAIKAGSETGLNASLKNAQDIRNNFLQEQELYRTALLGIENDYKQLERSYYDRWLKLKDSKNAAEAANAWRDYVNAVEQTKLISAQIHNLETGSELNVAKTGATEAQEGLFKAQTITEGYKPAELVSRTASNYAAANASEAIAARAYSEVVLNNIRAEYLPEHMTLSNNKLREEIAKVVAETATEVERKHLTHNQTSRLFYQTLQDKVGAQYAQKFAETELYQRYVNMAQTGSNVIKNIQDVLFRGPETAIKAIGVLK